MKVKTVDPHKAKIVFINAVSAWKLPGSNPPATNDGQYNHKTTVPRRDVTSETRLGFSELSGKLGPRAFLSYLILSKS